MSESPDLERAVRDQLAGWGLDASAEGAVALDLARRISAQSPHSPLASPLYGNLRAMLADLRKLAPQEVAEDGVADLQASVRNLRAVSE